MESEVLAVILLQKEFTNYCPHSAWKKITFFPPSTSSHYDLSNEVMQTGFQAASKINTGRMHRFKLMEGVFHKGEKKKIWIKSVFHLWMLFLQNLAVHSWTSIQSKLFAHMRTRWETWEGYPNVTQSSFNSAISAFDSRKCFSTLSLQIVNTAFHFRSKDCWMFERIQCKYD